ncbi:MAG TPA: transcription-repair coupling factor [Ktedonobacterales bacterium]
MSLRGLIPLLTIRPEYKRLRERIAASDRSPLIFGVADAARTYLVAALAADTARPLLYVVREDEQVQRTVDALTTLLGKNATILPYADRDALPYEQLMPDVQTVKTRLAALTALSQVASSAATASGSNTSPSGDTSRPGSPFPVFGEGGQGVRVLVVVASARALTQPVIPPVEFAASLVELRASQQLEPRDLLTHLIHLGYEPEVEVEEVGQVSHRGGIVDFFPPTLDRPVRVEFWGDEIESLRTFDPVTQRSLNPQERVVISPAREALAVHGPEAAKILEQLDIVGLNPDARERWRHDMDALRDQQSFEDIAFYLPYLHPDASLLDYLPANGLLVLQDDGMVASAVQSLAEQGEEVRERLVREGELPLGIRPAFLSAASLAPQLARVEQLRFAGLLADEGVDTANGSALTPDLQVATSYGGRLRAFAQDVRKLLGERQRVVIVSAQARRVAELFGDEALLGKNGVVLVSPATDLSDAPDAGTLSVIHGAFAEGWHSRALALSVFTDTEVFGWSKRRGEHRRSGVTPASFLAEVRPGDYVVHQDHGIGRFEGLTKINSEGVEREYLLIQYAGTDKLYIPTDQLDRLTRYLGMGDSAPGLSRLGGTDWVKAKQRARESATDIARDLLRLYSVREAVPGHPFPPDVDQPWLRELEEGFGYEETPDQQRAINEVKDDMERARPMDRLVCGDVGYGKTEVALRAAFKAVLDQRQVAVLVPTTVLALQHFNTFSERLKPYPVRVELLSRFRSEKEQKEVLRDLATGTVDIVIGTHRLLQKDVNFSKLGLLVIDEEQRFGVAHKERLKQLRTEVDVLTLTATPIPRTLYMALANVREMSVIETPPQERLPIRTHIREADDDLIREVILREIDRGGQVFFVHNRVKGIQTLAQKIAKLVPEAKVAVGHGQMPEDQLEQVMLDFASGATNVLVCTTIIENGLDIPNANTIIVNNAAFFGLSQLYQLRGRVGRGTHQAYAYFLYNKDYKLTPVAERRLRAIFEATELGAGFKIAMQDLEIRGAGNLLGAEQSGFMNSVGFDLYTRLLADAIALMQGEKSIVAPRPAQVTVELPVNAYIPDDYINDRTLKLHFYQRLANMEQVEQVESIAAELTDRFGAHSEPVANLLALVRLKLEAGRLGFESVTFADGQVVFKLRRIANVDRVALFKRFKSAATVSLGEVKIPRRLFPEETDAWLAQLRDLLPVIVGRRPSGPLTTDEAQQSPAGAAKGR